MARHNLARLGTHVHACVHTHALDDVGVPRIAQRQRAPHLCPKQRLLRTAIAAIAAGAARAGLRSVCIGIGTHVVDACSCWPLRASSGTASMPAGCLRRRAGLLRLTQQPSRQQAQLGAGWEG